ncbi:MAG: hypothetical protein ACE5GN_05660, partial [Waddliaceae bacterium]
MATSSASHSASGSHNGPQWPYYGPLAQYVKEQQVLEGEFKSIRDDKHVKVKQRYPKLLTFGEKSLGAHQRLLESNVKVILEHAALYRMAQGVIKAAFPLVSLSTDNQGREAKRAIDALRGVMLNQPQPPEKAAVTAPSESAEGPFIPVPYIIPETSRVAEKLKSQKPALLEIAASAFGPKVETPIHDLKQKLGEQQKAFAALDERSTSLTTVVSKSLEELAIQQNRLAKEWSQLLIGREFNAWELTRIEIFANILSELRDFSEKLEEFNKKRLTYQRDLENQKNPAPRLDEFKERF